MPPVLSKFERLPAEILDQIVLSLVASSFLGPPAGVLTILPLSRKIWKHISPENNPHLYSQIFRLKFDHRAAVRRLGDQCKHTRELAHELVRRCNGLKRLRQDEYIRPADGSLRVDLWMVYLMFLESDGKNNKQLINYARVDSLSLNFISHGGRFHDGMEANGGWTVDSEVNALTAWIFWYTDRDRVASESPAERRHVLQAFAHFFVGSFKYCSTHAPLTLFLVPPPQSAHTASPGSHGTCSLPRQCTIPEHFGAEITVACPLLAPAALLACAVRFETASAEADVPLPQHIPETRAEAIATQWQGPTKEEHQQQNRVTTRCLEWYSDEANCESRRHDHDWSRLFLCYEPWHRRDMRTRVFTLGDLHGKWEGRYFEIPINDFNAILAPDPEAQLNEAPQSPFIYTYPMEFKIMEHHQHEPGHVAPVNDISTNGTGSGVFNAWLPTGTKTRRVETEGKLEVFAPNMATTFSYTTHDPVAAAQAKLDEEFEGRCENEGHFGEGVWDILVTAETSEKFGRAWGHKRYYGRVRAWDGLIVLVREAAEVEDHWIFSGYLHGGQNLVGRWRETRTPVDMPGWEGVWSMTKVEGK